MGALHFESIKHVGDKEEIDVGFMSWDKNKGTTFLAVMISEFLQENFIYDDLLEDPLEDLVQKPRNHSNNFEVVSCEY